MSEVIRTRYLVVRRYRDGIQLQQGGKVMNLRPDEVQQLISFLNGIQIAPNAEAERKI